MKLRAALFLGLVALAAPARAADPVCAAARDPQLVTPRGALLVLDRAGSSVLGWSLVTRGALPPLAVASGAVAFDYLAARDALVIEHASPARLTLRALAAPAPERPFVAFGADDGEPCGLAVAGDFVVACVDHTHYVVFDSTGALVSDARIGGASPTGRSFDGMVWDGETRKLYATRKQATSRTVIALPIGEDGSLGAPSILPIVGGHADLADEFPMLLSNPSRLLTPDGLIVRTDPLVRVSRTAGTTGEAFSLGDAVFFIGDSVEAGCTLSSPNAALASDALLAPGLVRSASWQGRAWLLRGTGATASLAPVKLGAGDLDLDRAPDSHDFFPLDPVKGRDWDHDGVDDKHDALPTKQSDWLDADGDGVGDETDAFPGDPNEWADRDGDGVGDNADACSGDPAEHVDSDSDGACDGKDEFPTDPLEHVDSDGDGVGDQGDAFPDDPDQWQAPFGAVMQVFDLTLKRAAVVWGFPPAGATTPTSLALYDDERFTLSEGSGVPLTGTFERAGARSQRLLLRFDTASLSRLEPEFAAAAAAIVLAGDSPPLAFTPRSVTSDGVALLTKQGVTLSLRVRFAYERDPRTAPGWRGIFFYRGTGTPEPP